MTETQDNLVYCVGHAIEQIKSEKLDVKSCKLIFVYDDKELDELTVKISESIESKGQKKTQSKYAGMPTLLKWQFDIFY